MERREERASDEDRLGQWVRRHADALRGYLWTLLVDKSAVEDVLQDVFLRAWRGRASYIELGQEKAYLFRIADRLVLDRARAKHPTVVANDLLDSIDVLQAEAAALAEQREDEARLADAIRLLSDMQRRAILLRYFGSFDFDRIAEILGCPRNTALSHVHRGLERLRGILRREVPT